MGQVFPCQSAGRIKVSNTNLEFQALVFPTSIYQQPKNGQETVSRTGNPKISNGSSRHAEGKASSCQMLTLSAPWWYFILRGIVVYVLVTVLMRVSGKRAMGQFTPFDMILLILIGNTVQNGINGGDNSLTGAFIMATTLIILNWIVA
ncbi:DUF421 domain-containing protein [Ochrobactrum soli]|uniref:DUF421 domain-containing protein n=1 Tax=Ochrobactrum soli TaxID=2448455 RepID=UPI001AECECE2|nr:hypothetical protein [[Ochrobactrum] soli]